VSGQPRFKLSLYAGIKKDGHISPPLSRNLRDNHSKSGSGCFNQLAKCRRIVDGYVSQDFSIQLHTRLLQPEHKLTVTQPILASGRVNPGNPEATEITFANTAITIRVYEGLHHGLIATLKQPMLTASLPFGKRQHFLVFVSGFWTGSYSHNLPLLSLLGIRKKLLNPLTLSGGGDFNHLVKQDLDSLLLFSA
jgi:hypothetical protein